MLINSAILMHLPLLDTEQYELSIKIKLQTTKQRKPNSLVEVGIVHQRNCILKPKVWGITVTRSSILLSRLVRFSTACGFISCYECSNTIASNAMKWATADRSYFERHQWRRVDTPIRFLVSSFSNRWRLQFLNSLWSGAPLLGINSTVFIVLTLRICRCLCIFYWYG